MGLTKPYREVLRNLVEQQPARSCELPAGSFCFRPLKSERLGYFTMSEAPDRAFEERLLAVQPTLRRWIYRTFGYSFPETDDCLQAAAIGLWEKYTKEPERLDQASDGLWVVIGRYAIRSYLYRSNLQVSRRKGARRLQRHAEQVIFTESELSNQAEDSPVEDLLSTIAASSESGGRSRETTEIRAADQRIELERILKVGFAMLDRRYHRNIRKLMADIMLGYKLVESQERHRWTQNQAATLMRLMRNTFREAATGEKVPEHSYRRCKPSGTADELQHIHELREQGLSYTQIGAIIGRSKGFVQRKVAPPVPRDMSKLPKMADLRRQGFSYECIGRAVGCSKSHVRGVLGYAQAAARV